MGTPLNMMISYVERRGLCAKPVMIIEPLGSASLALPGMREYACYVEARASPGVGLTMAMFLPEQIPAPGERAFRRFEHAIAQEGGVSRKAVGLFPQELALRYDVALLCAESWGTSIDTYVRFRSDPAEFGRGLRLVGKYSAIEGRSHTEARLDRPALVDLALLASVPDEQLDDDISCMGLGDGSDFARGSRHRRPMRALLDAYAGLARYHSERTLKK